MTAALLLAALLIALAAMAVADARDYARFQQAADTRTRQRFLRGWIVRPFVTFIGATALVLAVLGRWDAAVTLPREFASVAALLALPEDSGGFLGGLVGGAVIGGAMLGVLARRKRDKAPVGVGDFQALLPRNRAELALAAALSINAGVTEELFYRLALPLLLVAVTGNALLSFGVAAIVFGVAHLYQGVSGVLATTLAGVVLTVIYLASGSLLVAIAVHAVIDLLSLVVRPLLAGQVARY